MSQVQFGGSTPGGALNQLLIADDIQPGDEPSYQLCKTVFTYHPLGGKIAEKPIAMAQSKPRELRVHNGPEADIIDAFKKEWNHLCCDTHIFNTMRLSRVYGITSVAMLVEGFPTDKPVDYKEIWKKNISFNVFDPLNTAGSLVLDQNPNSMDFMKPTGWIAVQGKKYHPSRNVTVMNEDPIYISYTQSAFGFVGRSVYQRILFPLKSFIQTMKTNDLVAVKSGVIIAKFKQAGSIIDNVMLKMFGIKRQVVKEASTYNVISVDVDEKIETLNMQNLDGAFKLARTNILNDIAAGADDMPAVLLNQETFAEGFGEGTEDAKAVAQYIDRIRTKMQPLYEFFDRIVMHRAWNPEFYKTIQARHEKYKNLSYEAAFYEWVNSFSSFWPSFLDEAPSKKVEIDDVKLRAVIAYLQVLLPSLDPENKVLAIKWACDNVNELRQMFGSMLRFDWAELEKYLESLPPPDADQAAGEGGRKMPSMRKPMADSVEILTPVQDPIAQLETAMKRYLLTPPKSGRVVRSH